MAGSGRMMSLFVVASVLLAILAASLLGSWSILAGIVLLLALIAGYLLGQRTLERTLLLLGGLGGIVGAASAVRGMVEVGGLPVYADRLAFGWLALLMALLSTVAALLALQRPGLAGVVIFVASTVGFVAISLFYINTFYVVAVPLFWAAAGAALGLRGKR